MMTSVFPDNLFSASQPTLSAEALASYIDHTKLTFSAGEDEIKAIENLCREAVEYGFFSVCVRPRHVRLAKQLLAGTGVKVATVIGFPLDKVEREAEILEPTVGNPTTAEKLAEVESTLNDGVDELDLVLNVGMFQENVRTGNLTDTVTELKRIQDASQGRLVKVIIETDLLHSAEIEAATRCCLDAGVGMVKTCTGMVQHGRGATPAVVSLMKKTIEGRGLTTEQVGIKASGGIRTLEQALSLIQAGATRIGASAGVGIVQALTQPDTAADTAQSDY